jgi:hypothetical protein
MKIYLSIILIAFSSLVCIGQGISIHGIVYDKETYKPVPGAEVSTLGNQRRNVSITDDHGFFKLDLLPHVKPGQSITIIVSKDGYKASKTNVGVSSDAPTPISLEPASARPPKSQITINWNHESFWKSITSKNYQLCADFLQQGMKLNKDEVIKFYSDYFDERINGFILKNKGILCDQCPPIIDDFYYSFTPKSKQAQTLRKLCKCNSNLSYFDTLIDLEKKKIEIFRTQIDDSQKECLAELSPDGDFNIYSLFEKYTDEASKFNIFGQLTLATDRQQIVAEINRYLLVDVNGLSPTVLKKLFKKYCLQLYYRTEVDPTTLTHLIKMRDYWMQSN